MAECVSCGKKIPAGRFFCEECYVKMKGRMGPSGGVTQPSLAKTEVESSKQEISTESLPPPRASAPAGVAPASKPSGSLTPASGKKVLTLRSGQEKATKEKAGKKRFTITITFSERTYAAFERLKFKRKKEETAAAGKQGLAIKTPGRSRFALRGGGQQRRPGLKAVEGEPATASKRQSGFMGVVGYRDRAMDRWDKAASCMASLAVLLIILLSFQAWVKVEWVGGEAAGMQVIKVSGTDLGAAAYVCVVLAAAAFLYMLAAWFLKGVFRVVDYGAVLFAAGVVIIPLVYVAIASNANIFEIALRKIGASADAASGQLERQSFWTVYMMVLSGALLAFSGLVRLSERKDGKGAEKEIERGAG
jgi:hypothetical protein